MKSKTAFVLFVAMFAAACQPASLTQLPAATETPAPATATSLPSPTATPDSSYEIIPVSFESPGPWRFVEPYVIQEWPSLMVREGDAYKLAENYELNAIELSYQWWGLGDPVFNYQQIKRSGSGYVLGSAAVSRERIDQLIGAIRNLHPVPQMLSSITHTDDYPIWAVELTGEEGTKILLTSTSNTAAYVPWNVIYNGEIYSQFDGAIPAALAELFAVQEGQPMAGFYPGGAEEGRLIVNSSGWPNQMNYGFTGLLPLHTAFSYQAVSKTGEITGILDGRSSIGGFGNMVIGSITDLEEIVLERGNSNKVICSSETLPSDDPAAVRWSFKCPMERDNAEGPYFYPIHVTFGTDRKETITTDGNLLGDWNSGISLPHTPLPAGVAKALENFEPYHKLADDHQELILNFDAEVDTAKGNLEEAINAEMVFLGQLNLEGKKVPYSLTLSLGIEDGKVKRWDIDIVEFQSLLADVLQQPLTRNILEKNPGGVLNLYYLEATPAAEINFSEGMNFSAGHFIRFVECQGLPWREDIPDETTPLRGFAINHRWDTDPQFLLIDDTVRILDFVGSANDPDRAAMMGLLPEEMIPANRLPLEISAYFTWGPYMSLAWPRETSQEDKNAFTEMVENLPGTKEFFDWGVTIKNAVFVVNEQGTLDLVECKQNK